MDRVDFEGFDINKGLNRIGIGMIIMFLLGAFIVAWFWGVISSKSKQKNYIETTKPIQPVKILTTDGKKVDTLYRYYGK